VVLGKEADLRKWEAEEKLQTIVQQKNGKGISSFVPKADDSVTFGWFVKQKYIPMRRGRWRPATQQKTEFEIGKYLVENFKSVPIREIGLFELQVHLNKLAEIYSESIVRHAFVNTRSIMRLARKLKFLPEDPAEELKMPQTKEVKLPTMTAKQISDLINVIEDIHDLCLMSIALFCATRTSETLGLTWRSYNGDRLIPLNTAFEGRLYGRRLKTRESRNAIPIAQDVIPIIEAWRSVSRHTSPNALMFPTFGRGIGKGEVVPRQGRNFLKWRIYAHRRQARYSKETRDLSSDAPYAGHRHAGARDHEGCRNRYYDTPASRPQPKFTCRKFKAACARPSTHARGQFSASVRTN
jgi:integrase